MECDDKFELFLKNDKFRYNKKRHRGIVARFRHYVDVEVEDLGSSTCPAIDLGILKIPTFERVQIFVCSVNKRGSCPNGICDTFPKFLGLLGEINLDVLDG